MFFPLITLRKAYARDVRLSKSEYPLQKRPPPSMSNSFSCGMNNPQAEQVKRGSPIHLALEISEAPGRRESDVSLASQESSCESGSCFSSSTSDSSISCSSRRVTS